MCGLLKSHLHLLCYLQGKGYSLPADIQYVDARWQVPVLLPLRDCLSQELSTLCQLDGFVTVFQFEYAARDVCSILLETFIKFSIKWGNL